MDFEKYWDASRDDYSDRPNILFQDEHLPYLDGYKRVIDLGCGNGNLVRKLNERGFDAHGITYNVAEVNARLHSNVVWGDMHDIPFNDGEFDAFVMWDSLEHCQSAYIALCHARRVIRAGGRGLIFMPPQKWLDCRCHITCYTVPQMKQLFKQSGWTLVEAIEKKYPNDPNESCDGMAVYTLVNDPNYKAVFTR